MVCRLWALALSAQRHAEYAARTCDSKGVMRMTPPDGDDERGRERALNERDLAGREFPSAQPDDNELRASGQVCERCGGVITASQDVHRLLDGHFVHEACPRGS